MKLETYQALAEVLRDAKAEEKIRARELVQAQTVWKEANGSLNAAQKTIDDFIKRSVEEDTK
jgi:hypothetical protein